MDNLMRRALLSEDYIQDDPYSPSFEVRAGSQLTSSDFEATTDYGRSVVTTSVALTIVGIICLLLFACGLFFRCCFSCCRCRPKHPASLPHHDNVDLYFTSFPWNWHRISNAVVFYLLCALTLIFNQFLLVGRVDISKGIETIKGGVHDVFNLVQNVTGEAQTISDYSILLGTEYDQAKISCPLLNGASSDIDSALTDFQDEMQKLNDLVDPLDVNTDIVDNYLDRNYAGGSIFYILWGMGILVVFLFLVFSIGERRDGMRSTVCFGSCVYFVFVVFGCLWMLFTMALGDFCMSPSYNLVRYVPSGDPQDVAVYYTSCQGENKLQPYLSQGTYYVNYFSEKLNSIPFCQSDANIQAMKDTVLSVNGSLNIIYDTVDCTNIRGIWRELVNEGTCDELYQGIFYVWGSQLLTSFFLFLLMLVATCTYQFYLAPEKLPGFDSPYQGVGDEDRRSEEEEEEKPTPYNPSHVGDADMEDSGLEMRQIAAPRGPKRVSFVH